MAQEQFSEERKRSGGGGNREAAAANAKQYLSMYLRKWAQSWHSFSLHLINPASKSGHCGLSKFRATPLLFKGEGNLKKNSHRNMQRTSLYSTVSCERDKGVKPHSPSRPGLDPPTRSLPPSVRTGIPLTQYVRWSIALLRFARKTFLRPTRLLRCIFRTACWMQDRM